MTDDWITTSDASTITGYHPEHLRRLMREGMIRGRKFGIVWQVSRISLMKYLKNVSKKTDGRWGPK